MNKSLYIALFLAVTVAVAVTAEQDALAARKALLVGVEEYSNPDFNLKGVTEDVRLLSEMLVKTGMFTNSEIRTLVNREATKSNIVSSFKEWLVDGTRPGDIALFYFSGHGIQVWDENGDEIQDGKDEALMAWDAKVQANREQRTFRGRTSFAFTLQGTENFILDDEINEFLKQMKGRTLIFLSDSCHSGSVYKRLNPFFVQYKTIDRPASYKSVFEPRVTEASPEGAARKNTNLGSDLMVDGVNMIAFTASEDAQPAEIVPFDKDPKGLHSVFTWYLLKGLAGKADLNGDGKVTAGTLAKYLSEELKRDGYAQIPQHEFQPKSLENLVLVTQSAVPEPSRIERPTRINCYLKTDNAISQAEKTRIQSYLGERIPALAWTADRDKTSCMMEVERSGSTYGARLSDSTGTYWEPRRGSDLNTVLDDVGKDLRGYYVQTNVSALRNPANTMAPDLDYTVKSSSPRNKGEIVKGDAIDFRAKLNTPGYLYIFSVDTVGSIYPLYPGRDGRPKQLKPNESIVVPDKERLIVNEPFGRELVFAVVTGNPMDSLSRFWSKDEIGDPRSQWLSTEQSQFLDALWTELTHDGRPRGDWNSRLWSLKSFERAK